MLISPLVLLLSLHPAASAQEADPSAAPEAPGDTPAEDTAGPSEAAPATNATEGGSAEPSPEVPAAAEPPRSSGDTPDVPIEELPILEGPQIREYVEAPYPPEAEAEGIEGTVVLLVEIDEQGGVTYVEVLAPVGYGFDEAAVAAVEQMLFTPAMTEAGPVSVAFEFAYGFSLAPEEPTEDSMDALSLIHI